MGEYRRRTCTRPNSYTVVNALLSTADSETIFMKEAIGVEDSEKWQKAIKDKAESFDIHDTWGLAFVSDGQKILSSRFVFMLKRKMNKDGNVAEL